ncbi:hypothetical protein SLS63_005257 [Diaporthe eres]|uniref:Ketosynthase family 3 (KS3) domain-containing protein n=1 Tax=Diaporthe eres TaxID=83184 RepID=A0ABR1PC49_DIAER
MACRLGEGVNSPSSMWDVMVNKELKTAARVPESRFNIDAYLHPGAFTRPSSITSPGGGFIDTPPENFDPEFFGMEEDEALQTDPQHRRMLELVYECLESAGITKDAVAGTRTGVYVGNFNLDAVVKSCRHEYDRHAHATMSIDPGLVSSRISFWYDLKGPVFTINTGCTSVFFATDTACLALRAGDCDAAIIGGVNLLQSPEQSISISKYGVLSPDSTPLPFDSNARGYLRSEGVGAIYVKRLSDAIRDRDPIRGVIRCAHVNSNGSQPGLPMFTPNRVSIERMVGEIYKKAGLDPNETAYVEPQGIGLAFADVSEQVGIGSAMRATRSKENPVLIGSLKGNFGHQEAGSGVFSLIKAAMMTEAGVIPGLPNFKNYHPKVDADGLNIKVQTETIPWPESYATRRVGISSWGWSGTNGHILVEALDSLHPGYQQGKTRDHADYDHSVERPLLITHSAHTRNALRKNIVKHQGLADKYYMADLAYTLNVRRTKFKERSFAVLSECSKTEEWAPSAMTFGTALEGGRQPAVAFMFVDPRSMLRSDVSDWLKHSPTFLRTIRRLDQVFACFGNNTGFEEAIRNPEMDPTSVGRDLMPYLAGAAMQIALVDILAEWNVYPTASLAHSGAELLAAYSSGHLSAPEVLLLLSCTESGHDPHAKIKELNEEDLAWRRPCTAVASLVSDEALRVGLSQTATGRTINGHQDFGPKALENIKLNAVVEIGRSECLPEEVTTLPKMIGTLLEHRSKAVNFSETLAAAGALYTLGYPVDLEAANAIHDVDWKPMLLVDLPPYQWDHSRSLMIESHAMREERLCGVPYHELLGRRVHGLSPRSMIWKNPFVQDNVSWLYGSRPTATLSAALCLSLAIEALTQAFESRRPHDFSLRGFVFQNNLPFIKTDEILELQTCIQSLPSRGAQEQTYLVGIESVRDGRWTTHCEGTAVVSTHPARNGSTTENSGPDLDASAKKSSRTTALDRITREDSDPYQLHPLTIYGCLQHALASATSDKNTGGGGGDSKPGSTVGLKVIEVEEFKVWSGEEKTCGSWTVHATRRSATLGDQIACVDVDLKDEAGAVASTLRGLHVIRCEETHEAFDTDLPPPDPKARIPAFLRPLLG